MGRSFALPAVWMVGVVSIAISGTATDQYLLYVRGIPEPHPYPWGGVFLFIGVATVEWLLVWATLRPRSFNRSWLRALIATGCVTLAVVYFGMGLMHSTLYMFVHFLWLLAVWLALTLLTICSGIGAFEHLRWRTMPPRSNGADLSLRIGGA